jgi:hypothetical protein
MPETLVSEAILVDAVASNIAIHDHRLCLKPIYRSASKRKCQATVSKALAMASFSSKHLCFISFRAFADSLTGLEFARGDLSLFRNHSDDSILQL